MSGNSAIEWELLYLKASRDRARYKDALQDIAHSSLSGPRLQIIARRALNPEAQAPDVPHIVSQPNRAR